MIKRNSSNVRKNTSLPSNEDIVKMLSPKRVSDKDGIIDIDKINDVAGKIHKVLAENKCSVREAEVIFEKLGRAIKTKNVVIYDGDFDYTWGLERC